MTVYSTQFFLGVAATNDLLYTVPTGQVAVLRDVSGFPSSGFIDVAEIYEGTDNVYFLQSDWVQPNQGMWHWKGRVVLNSGQSLKFYSYTGATWSLYLGGYLFPTP